MTTLTKQSVMPHKEIVPPRRVARICPKCGLSSLQTSFYQRKTGRLSERCIECEKASVSERYQARKALLLEKKGKLCACGCGGITSVSTCSDKRRNLKVGDPLSFLPGHARRLSPVAYIIEDRGYETPCWIWQLSKDKEGYGFITVAPRSTGRRTGRAHAVYYERKFGSIAAGMVPDHLCRVRSCVNPDHIEAVTPTENVRRGVSAKLNANKVADLRRRIVNGELQDALADEFGVSQSMISRIKLRKAWADIA